MDEPSELNPKARADINEVLNQEEFGDKPRPPAKVTPLVRSQLKEVLGKKRFGEGQEATKMLIDDANGIAQEAWDNEELVPEEGTHPGYVNPLETLDNADEAEPLPSKEREDVRMMYRDLMNAFPKIGFTKEELATGFSMERQTHLLGIDGTFWIGVWPLSYEEEATAAIHIRRLQENSEGERSNGEELHISSDGTLSYEQWNFRGVHVKGHIGETTQDNTELVLARTKELIAAICESINNPQYSLEKIREYLIDVRKLLLRYFGQREIVPQMESRTYHYKPGPVANLMELATGEKEVEQEYEIKVGKIYPGIKIPGLPGVWGVTFDLDVESDITRAKGPVTDQCRTHGTGVVLLGKRPRMRYVIWENGDAETPNGIVTNFFNGAYSPYSVNPHQVLMDFLSIEHAMTGKPLPREMQPKRKPGIWRFFKR